MSALCLPPPPTATTLLPPHAPASLPSYLRMTRGEALDGTDPASLQRALDAACAGPSGAVLTERAFLALFGVGAGGGAG